MEPRRQQQQQKQQKHHAHGVETLGDNGEPPEPGYDVTRVVHAEPQQEPSPPVASAHPLPLSSLDEPDMADGDVVSGAAVRREPSVTEEFGGLGVLGFGPQQQVQEQQQSEPVAVGAVGDSNVQGTVRGVATNSGTGSVRRSVLQK